METQIRLITLQYQKNLKKLHDENQDPNINEIKYFHNRIKIQMYEDIISDLEALLKG